MIASTTIYSLCSLYATVLYNQREYKGKPINLLKDIFEAAIPKMSIMKVYYELIQEGWLTPIEKLPEEERIKLCDECRTTGINFTNATLTNSARILHTIKFINANS